MRREVQMMMARMAVETGDGLFDDDASLLRTDAWPTPIHTAITEGRALNTRVSAVYAVALAEMGRHEDAGEVIHALARLQDRKQTSSTYGLWGYWAEEPPSQMRPADHNWADFIGESLAHLLSRHRSNLDPGSRQAAEESLHHAARAIMRRNVDVDYTNIAAKGAFVTYAAGGLLGDPILLAYGDQRVRSLADHARRTGGFAEYASPEYWRVTMDAYAALRAISSSPEAHEHSSSLVRHGWNHFLARWHAPTQQLGGPMARCYHTDLRTNPAVSIILHSAAPGLIPEAELRRRADNAKPVDRVELVLPALIDHGIPHLREELLRAHESRRVSENVGIRYFGETNPGPMTETTRETLSVRNDAVATTESNLQLTLGSINHGDSWVQRRPLLAYWRHASDDPSTAPLRAVELAIRTGDKTVAAGVVTTHQSDGLVTWSVGAASPTGWDHIHLDATADPLDDRYRSLEAHFDFTGIEGSVVLVDDEPLAATATARPVGHLTIVDQEVQFDLRIAVSGSPATAIPTPSGLRVAVPLNGDSSSRFFAAGYLEAGSAGETSAVSVDVVDGDGVMTMAVARGPLIIEHRARSQIGTRREHALATRTSMSDHHGGRLGRRPARPHQAPGTIIES